jgi:hypothetical protein
MKSILRAHTHARFRPCRYRRDLLRLAAFGIAVAAMALVTANGVAMAAVVDLTAAGASGVINAALFEQIDPQSTGTGTISSFAQQSPHGNGTTSRAYNTTVNNVLDNSSSDNFNRSIFLSDVPTVLRAGTPYRQFLLDVNENSGGGNQFISLDEIQVFVGGAANSSVTTFTAGVLDHDGALVYRLDAGADNWISLNYALNSGSGSGDMFLLIPSAAFAGFAGSDAVTLYSQFGLQGVNPSGFTGNFGGSAGFEEWAVLHAPEPSALVLGVFALAAAALRCRAKRPA